jgi:hypothetical protein
MHPLKFPRRRVRTMPYIYVAVDPATATEKVTILSEILMRLPDKPVLAWTDVVLRGQSERVARRRWGVSVKEFEAVCRAVREALRD